MNRTRWVRPSAPVQAATILLCGSLLAACGGGGKDKEPNSFTVTATAGAGGSIAPGSRMVPRGQSTTFTVAADTGYQVAGVTGCGGTLAGNQYTTAAITAPCSVSASFSKASYTVNAIAGDGGSISPGQRTVQHGDTAQFSLSPAEGYQVVAVTGCNGSLDGNTYTTGTITAACTVSASFGLKSYTLTATATEGGSISPASTQVAHGSEAEFVVSANNAYVLSDITGCNGTLNGTVYRTAPVTAACAVTATFAAQAIDGELPDLPGTLSAIIVNNDEVYFHPDTQGFIPVVGHPVSPVAPPPADLYFPAGLFHFTAVHREEGGAVVLELQYPQALPENIDYWKFGPTSAGAEPRWYTLPAAQYQLSADRTRITLTIVDGQLGDSDAEVNGIIRDPGGPAIQQHAVTATAGSGGSITPPNRTVNHGASASFTVTADTGYRIDSVSGCGGSLSGTTYTTGPITGACAVEARFALNQYTVTASAGANGSITPPEQTVTHGATTSFTVTPAEGFSIASVAGCNGRLDGNTYTTGPITANCAVSASFAEINQPVPSFTLTASAGTGGSISPNSLSVAQGDTGRFTVSPDSGYSIASVTGCNGSLDGNTYTTGPITAACSVSASFSLNQYTVSASAGANGSITPAEQTVNHGATTSFTVTPDAGYSASVSGCGGSLDGNTYTTGPITGACSVTASFAPKQYLVSANAGPNGSIAPPSRMVNHGATTSFTVTPATGYSIDNVSGCGGSLDGTTYTTGAITGACSVTASFRVNSYTVTATAEGNGSITPPSQTVNHGATTSFTVTPDAGYSASVSGCGGSLDGTTYTTGPITSACSITASFSKIMLDVTASVAGSGGTIAPAGTVQVEYGQTRQFTLTPDTANGYIVDQVTGSCDGSLSGTTFTTAAITANCTVVASFKLQQYTVTATADANGTIDPASRLVNHGEATSFTLQPNSGYRVATVTGCNGSRSGSTYTTGAITANCTVEATFAETAIAGSVTATIVNDEDAFFDPGSLGVIPLTGHPNSPAIAPPADLDFPAGLFDFKAEHNTAGGTLTLRLEYQAPLPEYSVYWIFGPTTEGGAAEWYALAPEQFSLSEDRTRITLTLVDGEQGDGDRAVNRLIGNLGGPAIQQFNVTATAEPSSGGTVSPGSVTVNKGDTSIFTLSANSGYRIAAVTGCDGTLAANSYTTGKIYADCTIGATFAVTSLGGDVSGGDISAIILNDNEAYFDASSLGMVPLAGDANSPGTAPPADLVFPAGLFDFKTVHQDEGGTLQLQLTYPTPLPAFSEYWVYGPTAVGGAAEWYALAPGQFSLSEDRTRITLTLVDGEQGDGDRAVNRRIGNLGGPAIQQFTVTATASAGGTVSPGSATVNKGGTTSFTVTPATGYSIASVTGCNGSLSGNTYTTGPITAACSVSASFSLNQYTVSASAGPNGSITPAVQTVNHGATTSFTVTPAAGYSASVSGCGGSLVGTTYTTGAITGACSVTASFSQIQHAVTASAGANGSIAPSGVVQVSEGANTQFIVTPATGYSAIVGGTCGGNLEGNIFTTNTITTACTVTANFSKNQYRVDTQVIAGSGTFAPTSADVVHDGNQVFEITPTVGYQLDSVTGCLGTLAGTTFTAGPVTAACTLSASFSKRNYAITTQALPASGGIIEGPSSVEHGSDANFSITVNTGYQLDSVSGAGCTVEHTALNTSAIARNVTSACTVTANFSKIMLDVTATAGSGGTIDPAGTVQVEYGQTREFTLTPATGYSIDNVSGCGGSLSGNTFTTAAITANCDVVASFKLQQYSVTAEVERLGGQTVGTITPSATSNIDHGSTVTFTLTADTGFGVAEVSGDNCIVTGTGLTREALITSDCTVTARFEVTLAAPQNLRATADDGSISFSWDEVADATGYNLYYGTGAGVNTLSILVQGVSRYYVLDSLNNDTPYYAVVTAVRENTDAEGAVLSTAESAVSNEVSATPFNFAPVAGLNDTGQQRCANATDTDLDCPVTVFPGQDAEFGRDADANLVKIGGGDAGFDFTKLGADGTVLAIQDASWSDSGNEADGTSWSCVRDNVTGLVWEIKTNSGLRNRNHTFTWYNTDASNNGGDAGTEGDNSTCGLDNCNTQAYVAAVNALDAHLCGANDWRLPTASELQGLLHYGKDTPPLIDSHYFPDADFVFGSTTFVFWSSSPRADDPAHAWGVVFSNASVGNVPKSGVRKVRLVRAGQ